MYIRYSLDTSVLDDICFASKEIKVPQSIFFIVSQVPGTVRLDYQMMPVLQKRRQIQRGWVTYRRPHSKWPCQMKNSGRSVCVYVCVSVLTGV